MNDQEIILKNGLKKSPQYQDQIIKTNVVDESSKSQKNEKKKPTNSHGVN